MLGTSVLDETGLKGAYDFKLEWIRDAAETAGEPAAARTGTAAPERASTLAADPSRAARNS